jgi:glutaredoxin
MALISDEVRQQLKQRFETRLKGQVRLTLYTKPGSSRLILPTGMGCQTCDDAKQIAELLHESAPEKVELEVVDVNQDRARAEIDEIVEVPTIAIGSNGDLGRIRFQGLPTGTEFPAFIEAVERISSGEHGLSADSVTSLEKLTQPTEVMVFATPT